MPHSDTAKKMKRLVKQKLFDIIVQGFLQIFSGYSSFINPSEESLDILPQKHS